MTLPCVQLIVKEEQPSQIKKHALNPERSFSSSYPACIKGIKSNSVVATVVLAAVNEDNETKGRIKEIRNHLLTKYKNVVALPSEPLCCTDLIQHHIPLAEGIRPTYVPSYHVPHGQRVVVDKYIRDMLEQGVISHSMSLWNVPLFFWFRKKRNEMSVIVDLRGLNEVMVPDRYPMPLLRDVLPYLGGENIVFKTLDLITGFLSSTMGD